MINLSELSNLCKGWYSTTACTLSCNRYQIFWPKFYNGIACILWNFAWPWTKLDCVYQRDIVDDGEYFYFDRGRSWEYRVPPIVMTPLIIDYICHIQMGYWILQIAGWSESLGSLYPVRSVSPVTLADTHARTQYNNFMYLLVTLRPLVSQAHVAKHPWLDVRDLVPITT